MAWVWLTCAKMGRAKMDLFRYDEVPSDWRRCLYITGGYRRNLSQSACIKSLFVFSNESVNIWSHLVSFLFFFGVLLWVNFITIPNASLESSLIDHAVITFFLLCIEFCLFASTGYHLFKCSSDPSVSIIWYRLDIIGIAIAVCGCYIPGLYYGFYCNMVWRRVYVGAVLLVVLFCFLAQFRTQASLHHNCQLVFMYSLAAAFGFIPFVHWILISSSEIISFFAPKVIVFYAVALLGVSFYVSRTPEKLWPGKFNFIGASHQVWHVLIAVSFIWWYYSCISIYRYRASIPCSQTELPP
ncbi:progestin and adipoQ receptor family member 3-like [Oscarella lobularis]|uniref:progestin and adipoQ receptor family member 3-like n=1 Tax=Oscarella lobularis TaxID=121494 RepID=UPI00331355F1